MVSEKQLLLSAKAAINSVISTGLGNSFCQDVELPWSDLFE